METSAAQDNDNLLFIEDDYQALIWRPFKAHDDVIDDLGNIDTWWRARNAQIFVTDGLGRYHLMDIWWTKRACPYDVYVINPLTAGPDYIRFFIF